MEKMKFNTKDVRMLGAAWSLHSFIRSLENSKLISSCVNRFANRPELRGEDALEYIRYMYLNTQRVIDVHKNPPEHVINSQLFLDSLPDIYKPTEKTQTRDIYLRH